MEASTGNQEIGSILRCGKELEAPKRAADDSGRLLSPTLIEEGRLVSEGVFNLMTCNVSCVSIVGWLRSAWKVAVLNQLCSVLDWSSVADEMM